MLVQAPTPKRVNWPMPDIGPVRITVPAPLRMIAPPGPKTKARLLVLLPTTAVDVAPLNVSVYTPPASARRELIVTPPAELVTAALSMLMLSLVDQVARSFLVA